jgi:hypothetical protein
MIPLNKVPQMWRYRHQEKRPGAWAFVAAETFRCMWPMLPPGVVHDPSVAQRDLRVRGRRKRGEPGVVQEADVGLCGGRHPPFVFDDVAGGRGALPTSVIFQINISKLICQYIDASKRGGIGGFADHSGDGNCYGARGTVGRRVRTRVLSRRALQKSKERTFNCNVGQYVSGSGHYERRPHRA